MIRRAPQVHMFAGDPDHRFVEMPSISSSYCLVQTGQLKTCKCPLRRTLASAHKR
jgi:hypothetical protein